MLKYTAKAATIRVQFFFVSAFPLKLSTGFLISDLAFPSPRLSKAASMGPARQLVPAAVCARYKIYTMKLKIPETTHKKEKKRECKISHYCIITLLYKIYILH